MNLGNTKLELAFEKAVKLLCDNMPVGEERKKPLLMHSLRVGMFLYEHNYSNDIVLAGLLHDVLEWTEGPEELLRENFGERVFEIVQANTKNRAIEDPAERRREYIDRCIQVGEDALIVKATDALDSYHFYTATGNTSEIERSVDILKTILEKRPDSFTDPLFEKIEEVWSSKK